ncbi:MAG TPA: glycosyltransferase [Thermoleophilaceae bacterium]|nr:glycosyltransferase [Thermoleophilaceae bacterium]
MRADLRPMAIAPRAPGDYAPAGRRPRGRGRGGGGGAALRHPRHARQRRRLRRPGPRAAGRPAAARRRRRGVDVERPFVLQLAQLDRWDDPHAAIDAFRLAKLEQPDLRLVVAAGPDTGSGEDWRAANEVSDYAAGDEDILLLTGHQGIGGLEVGALTHLARCVLEQSLGEGFDLAPCEALWKRTPVVGAAGGGLPLVVRDGVDGFLCESTEEAAARIVELVRDPGLAAELGRAGRERVRERFLVTAAVERELRALGDTLVSA